MDLRVLRGAIPSFTRILSLRIIGRGSCLCGRFGSGIYDGFAGYDASVHGGVLGLDRRFDNAVVGVAGGLK